MMQLTVYYLLPHPSKLLEQVKLVPRKATIVARSSNAPPTDSVAPSSTSAYPASGSTSLASGSAPPVSTEASTGNSYLLRKRPMVVGASNLSKE
ncbi:unnamed protein product [Prunus armeniaca]|uniref:Uncharacterized protein n=1 Tax=Prunus armeniaca TaxID=36596 RepID=A0A6J5V2D0_PRUAR|nr:unnamed protein product [Prunus armeniaca]